MSVQRGKLVSFDRFALDGSPTAEERRGADCPTKVHAYEKDGEVIPASFRSSPDVLNQPRRLGGKDGSA
jgi:hypothetical protein